MGDPVSAAEQPYYNAVGVAKEDVVRAADDLVSAIEAAAAANKPDEITKMALLGELIDRVMTMRIARIATAKTKGNAQ